MRQTKLKPGQRYGQWLTIEFYSKYTEGKSTWKCICDCGFEKFIRGTDLLSGTTTKCLNCSSKLNGINRIKPNGQAMKNSIVRNIKRGANNRQLDISELNFDYIFELSQRACFYCDEIGSNEVKSRLRDNESLTMKYNGLDRVDNNKGYTKDNIVTCCIVCNKMKLDSALDMFVNKIKRIHNNLERILERSETIPEGSTDQVIRK